SEVTRPFMTAYYVIYQKDPQTDKVQETDHMIGYEGIGLHLHEWRPRLSPNGKHALVPQVQWKLPHHQNLRTVLHEVPIDLENGKWNLEKGWIVMMNDEPIPGSHQ